MIAWDLDWKSPMILPIALLIVYPNAWRLSPQHGTEGGRLTIPDGVFAGQAAVGPFGAGICYVGLGNYFEL